MLVMKSYFVNNPIHKTYVHLYVNGLVSMDECFSETSPQNLIFLRICHYKKLRNSQEYHLVVAMTVSCEEVHACLGELTPCQSAHRFWRAITWIYPSFTALMQINGSFS